MGVTERKRIVFLCSGGGGNLCFVHAAIQRGWIKGAEIVAVLTDRDCQANNFATSVGVRNRCIDFSDQGQTMLSEELRQSAPDLIVTTVHKVLGKPIVEKYREKMLNLHYSLLPAFSGLIGVRPVSAAIEYGARFTGVTVHSVEESVDGGRPVVQCVIPLHPEEDFDALMNLVFRCGCVALMAAVNGQLNGESHGTGGVVAMMGRTCLFSGAINPAPEMVSESLWEEIARKAKAG